MILPQGDTITNYDNFNHVPTYLNVEQWFEVSRGRDNDQGQYIRIVNSYGKLRDVYYNGGYFELHEGGELKDTNS